MVLLEPFCNPVLAHLPLMLAINLVAKDKKRDLIGVFRHRLEQKLRFPNLKILERFLVGDIIHEDACLGSTIECTA